MPRSPGRLVVLSPRWAGLALVASFAIAGCVRGSGSSTGGDGGDGATAPVDAASSAARAEPPPPPRHKAPPGPRPPPPPCKAATVEGLVTVAPFVGFPDAGVPLIQSTAVPDDAWIDVGPKGRLTTRDAVSTREGSFEGPGRFRVCIGHKEEAWVRSGVFESVGGAGERPGGEMWVATPLGVARYDVAKWRFTVTDKGAEARVSAGTAYLWPSDGASILLFADAGAPPSTNDQGWVRLDNGAGAKLTSNHSLLTPEGASAALERCVGASREAMAITAALADSNGELADLASRDVVARRAAHAACAVAGLRIVGLPPSPARDASLDRLRTAVAGWESLTPPPAHPTGPGVDPRRQVPAPSGAGGSASGGGGGP